MAGKSKLVMGTGHPEEIRTEYRCLAKHWINLKKQFNFGGLSR